MVDRTAKGGNRITPHISPVIFTRRNAAIAGKIGKKNITGTHQEKCENPNQIAAPRLTSDTRLAICNHIFPFLDQAHTGCCVCLAFSNLQPDVTPAHANAPVIKNGYIGSIINPRYLVLK